MFITFGVNTQRQKWGINTTWSHLWRGKKNCCRFWCEHGLILAHWLERNVCCLFHTKKTRSKNQKLGTKVQKQERETGYQVQTSTRDPKPGAKDKESLEQQLSWQKLLVFLLWLFEEDVCLLSSTLCATLCVRWWWEELRQNISTVAKISFFSLKK